MLPCAKNLRGAEAKAKLKLPIASDSAAILNLQHKVNQFGTNDFSLSLSDCETRLWHKMLSLSIKDQSIYQYIITMISIEKSGSFGLFVYLRDYYKRGTFLISVRNDSSHTHAHTHIHTLTELFYCFLYNSNLSFNTNSNGE